VLVFKRNPYFYWKQDVAEFRHALCCTICVGGNADVRLVSQWITYGVLREWMTND